jgi:hypothetical protein
MFPKSGHPIKQKQIKHIKQLNINELDKSLGPNNLKQNVSSPTLQGQNNSTFTPRNSGFSPTQRHK